MSPLAGVIPGNEIGFKGVSRPEPGEVGTYVRDGSIDEIVSPSASKKRAE
jgi:hypothetical protein